MIRLVFLTIYICSCLQGLAFSQTAGISRFIENIAVNGRYFHVAATGCAVHVGVTDTSVVILSWKGDISVSYDSSSDDSLRIICRGIGGSADLRIPSAMDKPIVFIEYENSDIRVKDVIMGRVTISGIDGSVHMEAGAVDNLTAVVDRSQILLDTHTASLTLNTLDSRVVVMGRTDILTLICEGETLMTETRADTMIYDLKNVRSDIRFTDHSVRSGIIIGYLGEMYIRAPEIAVNRLHLRIGNGDYSIDENLHATVKSRSSPFTEVLNGMDQNSPTILIVTDGTTIELEGPQ